MKRILSAFLAGLSIFAFMLVYANGFFNEMNDGILRFHILANSDSEYDQRIKLEVRDYVSEEMAKTELSPSSGMYLDRIYELANQHLCTLGAPYAAKIKLTRTFVPRKKYKNITLPAGRYNAVQLMLGNGEGQNWWCVAYPSLCFSEAVQGELSEEAKEKLEKNISKETLEVITSDVEYRFWIADFIGRLMK